MKKKGREEVRINVRVPEEEKVRLVEISRELNVTSTLIVREAVKQKVNELQAKLRKCAPGEAVTI